MVKYIPNQGDIIFVDFNPTKGHEQNGYRPAIVISSTTFNFNTKMVIVCPITSNTKEFPTHYTLQETEKVHGAVLGEHIISIDYEIRPIKFVEKTKEYEYFEILKLLKSFVITDF